VLVSRKSSSTPSLSEAVEPKLTIASTDQVASAENLTSSSSSEPVSPEYILLFCFYADEARCRFLVFFYLSLILCLV